MKKLEASEMWAKDFENLLVKLTNNLRIYGLRIDSGQPKHRKEKDVLIEKPQRMVRLQFDSIVRSRRIRIAMLLSGNKMTLEEEIKPASE